MESNTRQELKGIPKTTAVQQAQKTTSVDGRNTQVLGEISSG